MSHNFHALSLDVRTDEAFESQVRAEAVLRVRQAYQSHRNRSRQQVCPPQAASASSAASNTLNTLSPREKAHARKWRHLACTVALAAFGAGMLWPVAPAPEPNLEAPHTSRLVRVMPGELLASFDAPASQTH